MQKHIEGRGAKGTTIMPITSKWESTLASEPITKAQRSGLYKWGLPRPLVQRLTKSEARTIYDILNAIVVRSKTRGETV